MHDRNPHANWEKNFAAQMRILREARKLTQSDLARTLRGYGLAFHQQTIQKIETRERPVRLDEAFLIARVLDADLATMTSTTAPDEAAVRHAVDRLRARSATRAESLGEALAEWVDDVSAFVLVLTERLPSDVKSAADLDPATRWGMAWAIKTLNAYEAFLESWNQMMQIGGKQYPAYLDNDPAILPAPPNVLATLVEWRDRFGELLPAPTDNLPTHPPSP